MRSSDPLVESIARACDGLVVSSESDATISAVSFRPISGATLSRADVLTLVERDPTSHVDELSLSRFFEPLGRRRAWHNAGDAEMAQRFRRLERLLQRRLTGVRVFRIGERSIDVWVLGRARDGRVVGVQTTVVET